MFRRVGMYTGKSNVPEQETAAGTVFRKRAVEQEYFFYMNAACQAMILFCSQVRFMLAYICSLAIRAANNGIAVVMKKLKGKLRC